MRSGACVFIYIFMTLSQIYIHDVFDEKTLLFEHNPNGIDGGRRDAGDALRFAQAVGAVFFELLEHFGGEPVDFGEIEIVGDAFRLQFDEGGDASVFASNVAVEFRTDFDRLTDGGRKMRDLWANVCQSLNGDFGHFENLSEFAVRGQLRVVDIAQVGNASRGEELFELFDLRFFRFENGEIGIGEEPELVSVGRKSDVGVVFAEAEAEFGAARKHAVGLVDAAHDEVVDHDADVGFVAPQDERRAILEP